MCPRTRVAFGNSLDHDFVEVKLEALLLRNIAVRPAGAKATLLRGCPDPISPEERFANVEHTAGGVQGPVSEPVAATRVTEFGMAYEQLIAAICVHVNENCESSPGC
jgi:hypothetical protein